MSCICSLSGWCKKHKVNKGKHWHKLCQEYPEYFQAWEEGRGPGQAREHRPRVGSELKKLISWFPIPNTKGCKSCRALEGKMNKWGVEICEKKADYILNQLKLTAKKKGIPFSEFIARTLLNKAIRNSRK